MNLTSINNSKFTIFTINILKKIGVDGAIFYTSLARIISAITGIISIFFIARFLNGIEQGFYYTFGSVLAIQVFFELGLNGIITQYVAHEAAHLTWKSETTLCGSNTHLSRLSSLLHFALKWHLIFAGFLFIILLVTGFVFFTRYDRSNGAVEWFIPWVMLSVSTVFSFLINPAFSFMEGLGKVKQVAQLRLLQQLSTTILIWITLICNAKLYSGGISTIAGIITVVLIFYFNSFRKILLEIWSSNSEEKINYKKEIFPYQWKIALSWVSGYFIFQLFNPVLFATEGAVVAGQMGMTLAALNGIFSLSISWMTTKVPLFSGLIAQKKYVDLDRIFDKTLKQSLVINGLGLVVLFIVIYGLRYFNIPLGNRFLPYLPLILMMFPIFMNQIVSSWATYLRCHKQEPFLVNSIVGGVATSLSTILLGKFFGVNGMTMGYCIITFINGIIWGLYIFINKKKEWHKSNSENEPIFNK